MSTNWAVHEKFRTTLRPDVVIDVGTARGTKQLYEAFPDAYYLLVEPLKENERDMKRILKQYKGEYALVAVGSQPGSAVLHVEPTKSTMSSFLRRTPRTATGDALVEREVPVTTLDLLIAERGLSGPFGLKIDTEGFELEVIRGATELLKNCTFIITEVSTAARFDGGYAARDLVELLRARDFVVADIMGTTRNYADLIFEKV